ncbi:MAG: Holliday junction resolvase [Candidatus Methanomethylophilaceae archaeon]|jgi:Holliday junction resolvase
MAAAGSTYERELKNLLSGDATAIDKIVRTCDPKEKEAYASMCDNPFLVLRAAGSLGVDLVALRWDFSFPIEVKSSNSDTLHFSRNPRLGEQAEQMLSDCQKSGLVPIYAFRLKRVRGDPWRIFTIPSETSFNGLNRLLVRRVPEVETSSNGNYIMRWENGMKLSEFLSYMLSTRIDD